jgi:acetoin utilization deacetylase AcuC-like enzyme
MLVVQNARHELHAGRLELYRGRLIPCYETPARLEYVAAELRRRGRAEWRAPGEADQTLLERVHSRRYLDFLAGAWQEWIALDPANADSDALPAVWPAHGLRNDVAPTNFTARLGLFSFDAGSPLTAGTWPAAQVGAACAIAAARHVAGKDGHRGAFALTRPPGHHAGIRFFGGYCFLNNAAIAAEALREAGADRVAVLDIDFHHGNGTQDIFYERGDVLTVSVHGDPRTEYPFYLGYADEVGTGPGEGCNLNMPLPPRVTGYREWSAALAHGLAAIARFGADALVVALGVDTFAGDPISSFTLASGDYLRVGEAISGARLPTVFTFEGGYAVAEIGINVANLLDGFDGGR